MLSIVYSCNLLPVVVWIRKLKERIAGIPETEFSVTAISQQLTAICEEENIKMGNVYPTFRYALTATFVGAGVPETIHVFGKERTLARLELVYAHHNSEDK